MPHSQCPNIKNEILQLRSKIGELKGLKTVLLQDDSLYNENLKKIQGELVDLIAVIDERSDTVANEMKLPGIRNSEKYGAVNIFHQGRAMAMEHGRDIKCFHIGFNGEPIYSAKYDKVSNYFEGKACARDFDGKCSHIEFDGRPAYDARYKHITAYSESRAKVTDFDGNQFYIDLDGNQLPAAV